MDYCPFQDVQTDSLGFISRTISNNTVSKVYIKDLLVKKGALHKERIQVVTDHRGRPSYSNLDYLGLSRVNTGIEQLGGKVHIAWDHVQSRTQRKSQHERYLGDLKERKSSLRASQCHSV